MTTTNARPRRNEEMKFAYAGPFVTLLDPIRPVPPARDLSGKVLARQPRYSATSAENWNIASAIRGTPAGDVLIPYVAAAGTVPKKRRRGGRGRKQVTS
jgi:hypothetical protein